ncbi:MAG: 3-methyl-2-oxobutanoate hydroxymethyltransferase [Gemmatimonadetes bacterium]|nr:3-methyl-2-oxobutanoate hydroxymethyltransferase [Gemmatimonadota bacterium]
MSDTVSTPVRLANREPAPAAKVTTHTLRTLKARGRRVVCVTAYDYPTAVFAERAGVDLILVGDSAAMTVLGLPNTLGVGMDEMLVFAKAVARGGGRAFVVGDLPFLSYQVSDAEAVRNAGAFVRAGCDAVKLEGGTRVVRRVRAIADAGIAVMGHIGLTPQALGPQGGYRVQGKTREATERIIADARALEDAGAFAILLEALPPESAARVREHVSVPVYGIGAGPHVDGQLVISHDLLGNFVGDVSPRFVSRLASLDATVTTAFQLYATSVRTGAFPEPRHCYSATPEPATAGPALTLSHAASN